MNEEKQRILELVQNGKLSAQEAIILLEALENEQKDQASTGATSESKAESTSASSEFQSQSTEDSYKHGKKETADSFYSQLETAGEQIFDFINQALNKVKNFDFPLNKSVDIPHVYQQAGADIEKIDIDMANGPVKIQTWDQPEVRVECHAKVFRYDDREDARNYFLENTVFNASGEMLIFATHSKWMRVETSIFVPEKRYKKIAIRIFNGGLTGNNLQASTVVVKTTNGKIELSNLEGEKVDVETVNGQIKLTESQVEKLEGETVNGTIHVAGTYQAAELQSLNGNIHYKITDPQTNRVEAKTITGNIDIDVPHSATIDGDVRSNLGTYKLDIAGIDIMHEKKEVLQKQVKFNRTGTDEQTLHLLADTKTGTIYVNEHE